MNIFDDDFSNFLKISFQLLSENVQLYQTTGKYKFQKYFHRKRPRVARGSHPNSIQSKLHAKQSTLEIDDFLRFSKNPKFSDSGSAPAPTRVVPSSFAVRSSRRAARPPRAA